MRKVSKELFKRLKEELRETEEIVKRMKEEGEIAVVVERRDGRMEQREKGEGEQRE